MSRQPWSPWRYDRAAIRVALEAKGRDFALARWPREVVDPIARALGLIGKYRGSDAWRPEWTPLLGSKPDGTLAGELGVSMSVVRLKRVQLGISTHDRAARKAARLELLRSLTDEQLAGPFEPLRALGLQEYQVAAERRRRSLRPHRTRRRSTADEYAAMRTVAVLAITRAFPHAMHAEIGDLLNCSRERIRQIVERESIASESTSTPVQPDEAGEASPRARLQLRSAGR